MTKNIRTLVLCIKENEVLLALKGRDFGKAKWNGYGGGLEPTDTSIEYAAVRELKEESNIVANTSDLEKVAEINFYFKDVPEEDGWDQTVHVYLLRQWQGEPKETDEMHTPTWFNFNALPNKMWSSDEYWLPYVLDGEKFKAECVFSGRGESVIKYTMAPFEF